ncbi:MAG: sodium/solute symporter [Bacteroidia bacterium]|nr:sodium/solute symporter [Bacteroidia bacterium]
MNSGFETLDYIIFAMYVVTIVGVGLYVSRNKKGHERSGEDYFLAGRNLTWWAIGASLIAANISAEHFIGMSGSGYAIGLGIAAYEWMAAITLIIVAKFFLPIFLNKGIYTTNQFLAGRFNQGVSSAFAIMWLLVYVFVNLTSVTYLGALAMDKILGIPVWYGIIGLAVVAGLYSIYGGLTAVAWTDVFQVIFLVGGGLVTTFLALDAVSPGSVFDGFSLIYGRATEHFDMVIQQGTTFIPDGKGGMKDAFIDLPGLAVVFGAMWLTNLGYWGFNQYIIQKGLAAKSMKEAKRGLIFAAFLKILIPLIVVIPGITAFVFFEMETETPGYLANLLGSSMEEIGTITKSDEAYPWLLKNFVPAGIRGLAFAALVAAIVSSLASMINSTSTIFTIDIYRPLINKNASEKQLVFIGRIVALVALVISSLVAKPLLGGFDQVFQYIQEYTGLIYPGVAVVFSMGLFWKRATTRAAIAAALLTFPFGIGAKLMFPEIPFLLRMGYVFIALVAVASLITFLDKTGQVPDDRTTDVDEFDVITHKSEKKHLSPLTEKVKSMMVRSSYLFGAIGLGSFVFVFSTLKSLGDIGVEAFIFFGTAMSMIGLVLYTNAKSKIADKGAIRYTPDLFKTGLEFNVGAVLVTLIVAILYYAFW